MKRFRLWRWAGPNPATALAVLAVTAAAVLVPVAPAATAAGVACSVQYTTNDWDTGFTANLTLRNDGDPITGWKLTWTFPDGQKVQSGWSGTFSQSGSAVTVTNTAWNGQLATGAGVSLGFNGTKGAANRPPTGFAVNGVSCGGPNKPPVVSLTAPTEASFTAPATIPLAATAADTDGSVSKVEFYADDQLIATDTAAPYQGNWSSVPVGTYTVTAKAYDNAGAVTASAPVVVQVLAGPTIVASPSTVNVKQGGTATFGLHLASKPSSTVTVAVARASGSTALTATPASLSFTTADWNTAQNVTVTSTGSDATLRTATFTATAAGYAPATATVKEISATTSTWSEEFLKQYNKIKDPASGYFRKFGTLLVPYHSIETLIVEAPDYGHETTSEAFSYYLWLEADYGRITGDWAPLNAAWQSLETYAIPSHADQPSNSGYNASKPATYAAEYPSPKQYPSQLQTGVSVGSDPIAGELQSAYGTSDVYGMHWLIDVDNKYGFGHCGDGTTAPAFINTFQRGSQESVWETVTQPSCDTFKYGGANGYLDLFTKDSSYAKQWKYTDAPDADARAVQVAYQAEQWAKAQGKSADVADVVKKASKMGDYLRYSMFDKYFKQIGNCVGASTCPAGSGKTSDDYLIAWYYAWGGSLDTSGGWAWRIGDGAAHQGYQNPMAAYALAGDPGLKPISATGAADWGKSLDRQLEFLTWLQSSEGGEAGGATNSWDGQYGAPPAGTPTFYGMFYDSQPVWHDPPSNRWFGFQTWGMERVAEYYQATGDARAKKILDKWVPWALANTTVGADGAFQVPNDLDWTGAPDTWNATRPGANTSLHVRVLDYGNDVGVAASLAKTLMYYAAGSGNAPARTTAEGLLTALAAHADSKGIAVPETRADYNRFNAPYDATTDQGLWVPPGWTGTMPNGDPINSNSTFLSIRSFYRSDPDWPKVQTYLDGGPVPTFTYHRFWSQSEIATAFGTAVALFG